MEPDEMDAMLERIEEFVQVCSCTEEEWDGVCPPSSPYSPYWMSPRRRQENWISAKRKSRLLILEIKAKLESIFLFRRIFRKKP